jgi:hypothetical protein
MSGLLDEMLEALREAEDCMSFDSYNAAHKIRVRNLIHTVIAKAENAAMKCCDHAKLIDEAIRRGATMAACLGCSRDITGELLIEIEKRTPPRRGRKANSREIIRRIAAKPKCWRVTTYFKNWKRRQGGDGTSQSTICGCEYGTRAEVLARVTAEEKLDAAENGRTIDRITLRPEPEGHLCSKNW